jgi:hypothetical protein
VIGIVVRREQWRRYAYAALVTVVVLPTVITVMNGPTHPDVSSAIVGYYNARGEQILKFNRTPTRYSTYLGQDATAGATPLGLAIRLVSRNAGDFANLLLDRSTSQALTHYSSVHGRLYQLVLVPFFIIGLGRSVWSARSNMQHTILLALFIGFGAPILLTSRVHIGRLVFLLPFLLLIVASGFVWTTTRVANRFRARSSSRLAGATLVACSILVLTVSWSTYTDFYHAAFRTNFESRSEDRLRSILPDVAEHGGVVLVTGDKGEVQEAVLLVSVLRSSLRDELQFIDLDDPASVVDRRDERLPLYHGVSVDHLRDSASIPGACSNIYLVEREIEGTVKALLSTWNRTCGQPPTVVMLQD